MCRGGSTLSCNSRARAFVLNITGLGLPVVHFCCGVGNPNYLASSLQGSGLVGTLGGASGYTDGA